MSKMTKSSGLAVGVAALLTAAALGVLVSSVVEEPIDESPTPVPPTRNHLISESTVSPTPKCTSVPIKSSIAIPRKPVEEDPGTTNALAMASEKEDDTNELMNEVVKEIMAQLADAAKSRDVNRILALVSKLRSIRYGKSGYGGSSSAKAQVLQMVANLGADASAALIAEVSDLMSDSDLAIALQARQTVFDRLNEPTMSDYDRSTIVTAAAETLTDAETTARLFQEFVRMRHSVGVEAFEKIESTGSDVAKSLLSRSISGFTSSVEITTAAEAKEWLPDNPDNSEYDDIFYGHQNAADGSVQAE